MRRRFFLLAVAGFLGFLLASALAVKAVARQQSIKISVNNSQIPKTMNWDRYVSDQNAAQFAWQTFVALNWPANDHGEPLTRSNDPDGMLIGESQNSRRVWEFFRNPDDEVFLVTGEDPSDPRNVCDALLEEHPELREKLVDVDTCVAETYEGLGPIESIWKGGEFLADIAQAEADNSSHSSIIQPLIDQQQNFVIYDVRINQDEFQQIVDDGLYNTHLYHPDNSSNDFQFKAHSGSDEEAAVSPMELKLAWRVFDDRNSEEEKNTYYKTHKAVCIPARYSITHEETCKTLELGLIGFHIAQKIAWENLDDSVSWVWSTFEHINNLAQDLESDHIQKIPTLFNPDCEGKYCSPNQIFNNPEWQGDNNPQWQNEPPYAQQYLPVQVERSTVSPIQDAAQSANENWQQALKAVNSNSVWQNYQLIGNEWTAINNLCNPSQPRTCYSTAGLLNVAMETYTADQFQNCSSCHLHAKLPDGKTSADFSFLLRHAASVELDSISTY